jgi:hypothetical protein
VRFFLGAHRAGLALLRIEQAGFLVDAAAILEIAIWRRASDSMAWPTKRIELTFLISQRVPNSPPGLRTDTLTSARIEPSSMLPSQVPR